MLQYILFKMGTTMDDTFWISLLHRQFAEGKYLDYKLFFIWTKKRFFLAIAEDAPPGHFEAKALWWMY